MKHTYIYLVTLLLVFCGYASAQNFLKNPGFETWNGNRPAFWSGDSLYNSNIAHSGSSALKLTNTSFFGMPFLGTASQDSIPVSGSSFSLKGWYQFYPVSGDQITIFIWIYGPNGIIGRLEGANTFNITQETNVWTAFAVGVPLIQGTVGDTASIDIWTVPDTASGNWHFGTYALFDDMVLDNTVTGIKENEFSKPSGYSLLQNYPNPFNPQTEIEFTIPEESNVTLKVYNTLGKEITTLVDGNLNIGRYKKSFDGSRLPSGVYFYRLDAVGTNGKRFMEIKKLMLLK